MEDASIVIAVAAVVGMAFVMLAGLVVAAALVRVKAAEARTEIKWLHTSLMDAWAGWQAANTSRDIEAAAYKRRLLRREQHIHRLLSAITDMGRGLDVGVPPMPADTVLGEMGEAMQSRADG
jgi:hypothetical protein